MEKMWSPWRSQYIQSFKDKKGDEECIFCGIETIEVNDDNNLVVYKNENCFIVLNLYPYNSGHLLIVPFRHLSNFYELTDEENLEVMKLLGRSMEVLDKTMRPHGYNMGANLGKSAGAGIDAHIHFHIVPRWNGDTNFMPAIGEVKVISQDLLQTKHELIKEFKNISM
ncbi:MAG: HIT domain-containing protein [bacterium]